MATPGQEQLQFVAPKFEMSPTIGQIVDALAKAHKQFKPILKQVQGYNYKYADLAAVIEATKDGLSDNGLAVIQMPANNLEGSVQVITILAHTSGEWIKTTLDMPLAKLDAQSVGSGITYGRRYSYSAIVNVASEEDDDATTAVSKPYQKPSKAETNEEFDQRTEGERNIPLFKVNAIKEACLRTKKTEAEALAYLNLIGEKRIEEIKNNQFDEFLKWANSMPKKAEASRPAKADMTRQKHMALLFALAGKGNVPEADLKQMAYERYHVSSMTELSTEQLADAVEWVRAAAEGTLEAR